MKNSTVTRAQASRPEKNPTEKTTAAVGQITKGSGSRTRAHLTTSDTTFPPQPVPKEFLNKLAEMHRAEKELTLALPLVAKAAKSKDLKDLLKIHLAETKGHVKALENVADSLGVGLPSKSCKKMTQLIGKGVKAIGKRIVAGNQDERLIAVGQEIEQFEIASYTPLCALAKEREYTHEFAILKSVLNQEKLANQLLGDLAAGKRPLGKVVAKASLKRAGARG